MRTFIAFVMLAASSIALAQEQSVAAPRLLRAEELPISVDQTALQRQFNALQSMDLEALEYSPRGPVQLVQGNTGIVLPASVRGLKEGDSASDVLPVIADVLLANGNETFKVRANETLNSSSHALRLSQSIGGIPVFNGRIAMSYDSTTLRVSGLSANFVPNRNLPRTPKLSAKEAEQVIPKALQSLEQFRDAQIEVQDETYLAYYAESASAAGPCLVWVVSVVLGSSNELFFVNALTGEIAGRFNETQSFSTTLYNANNQTPTIPGGLPNPMSPSQIDANQQATEARAHVTDANGILKARFPYAVANIPPSASIVIRYFFVATPSDPFSNPSAAHHKKNGIDYLRFSDATGGWAPFTRPRDIPVHEFGHGIAKNAAGFGGDTISDNQVGAIHEFFADLVTTVVAVQHDGVLNANAFRIGEGIDLNSNYAFRSLKQPIFDIDAEPHQDWFPLRAFGSFSADLNSTILGHAYYMMIFGGYHEDVASSTIPDINVPALSTSRATSELIASNIMMRAFRNTSMDVAPTFKILKTAAMAEALGQYGSAAQTSIKKAFEAVGICGIANSPPPAMSLSSLGDLMCAGRFNPTWPSIPGATRYYSEVGSQQLGFALATPVSDVDGSTNHCLFQVSQPSVYHIRACNDCGCGPWSQTYSLPYWSPCP